MTPALTRRAVLLGLALTAAACDVAKFALDPKLPSFEQTWNLPGTTKEVSVANLLPPGKASILPDSSGFSLTIDSTTITAVLGPNCSACIALNGTNAIKPAFTMAPGNSTALPTDIDSASITAGTINIALRNNLTFDPLYVNTLPADTATEGFLVIVVRSGSVVLGRDSVRGAAAVSGANRAPFPPGSTLNRVITLSTGTVAGSLTVDVTVNSPLGDHPVPIDVSKTFAATATVPTINVATVVMNVPGRTVNTGGGDLPLKDIPGSSNMFSAKLLLSVVNPFPGTSGALTAHFTYGSAPSDTFSKALTLPAGSTQQAISLDSANVQALVKGTNVGFSISGPVSSTGPIKVQPKDKVSITARLLAVIHTSTGGK